jgi:hypothetical protein
LSRFRTCSLVNLPEQNVNQYHAVDYQRNEVVFKHNVKDWRGTLDSEHGEYLLMMDH